MSNENKRIIKTTLDGIPVELSITKLGPASPNEVKNVALNLKSEDQNSKTKTTVVDVQNKESLSRRDLNKVEGTIKDLQEQSHGSEDLFEHLLELYNEIESHPKEKNWWESKTIWVNVGAIVAIIGSFFGLNLNIPPETYVTIAGVLMPLLNIWLRSETNCKVKAVHPIESIKKSYKKNQKK